MVVSGLCMIVFSKGTKAYIIFLFNIITLKCKINVFVNLNIDFLLFCFPVIYEIHFGKLFVNCLLNSKIDVELRMARVDC